jgi:hypothetical protein
MVIAIRELIGEAARRVSSAYRMLPQAPRDTGRAAMTEPIRSRRTKVTEHRPRSR